MTSYAEGLIRAVPSPTNVIIEETTTIVRRQGGWLGLLMLSMIGYGLFPSYVIPAGGDPYLFYQGRPGLAGSVLFVMLAVVWGLSVWSDLPRGGRTHQLALPLGRIGRLAYRTIAGALLLVFAVTASLVLGGLGSILLQPGTGYFSAELGFNAMGMLWTTLGLLNAYLLATLAALRFRRPDYVVLWVLFALLAAGMFLVFFKNAILVNAFDGIATILFSSTGIWAPTPGSVVESHASGMLSIVLMAIVLLVAVPVTMTGTREG